VETKLYTTAGIGMRTTSAANVIGSKLRDTR
jgi:hypothetical protein